MRLVRECSVVDIIPRLPPHPAAPAPINTHQRHDISLRYYRVVSQHDVERRVGGESDAARRVQRAYVVPSPGGEEVAILKMLGGVAVKSTRQRV